MTFDVVDFWDRRYRSGGNSGERRLPASEQWRRWRWRADQINRLAGAHEIASVLDVGSGDGRQARLLDVPGYLGVDPSSEAVEIARARCPDLAFEVLGGDDPEPRDCHLSLSVIFHLVDDADYLRHLDVVFSARRLVIVHASDRHEPGADHVLHRHWTPLVPSGWDLIESHPTEPAGSALTVWARA